MEGEGRVYNEISGGVGGFWVIVWFLDRGGFGVCYLGECLKVFE